MAYIIENANLLKESRLEQMSFLIKDERIHSVRTSFKRFSYIRVHADAYIMTPPHIVFSPDIPSEPTIQKMKQFFIDSFINRGCTMFLTYATVDKEYLFQSAFKEMKKKLLNSPIDYTIGVKIPLHLLTPSLIRKCKKEKIPAIFIEIDAESSLEYVPWGWIREAMFPYNSPLIPIFTDEKVRQRKRTQNQWTSILKSEKIPFIDQELNMDEPISLLNLYKLGIIPQKMGIHQGGEVSYNFYLKNDAADHIEERDLYQNSNQQLIITVHKGTVIRAGADIIFRPGFGEHVIINTPSFFLLA